MTIYEHTQPGTLLRWALGLSLAGLAAIRMVQGTEPEPADAIVATVFLLILAALILMHSLTVTVDDRQLSASFGPGLVRRSVRLDDVRSSRQVRNA